LSTQTFAELGVSPLLAQSLAKNGFNTPFAVQDLAIPDVLDGLDVLVKSPTGSGKTLAFAIPLIDRIEASGPTPAALVLAPTRELAAQIVECATPLAAARGMRIAVVHGGVGIEQQARKARRAHLVVATPGRLLDLLGRGSLSLKNVRHLVLDEADRMLDMGFRPDVERIVAQIPRERQTLFFSATLDGEVGRLASKFTSDAVRHTYEPAAEATGVIEHRFVGVSPAGKLDAVVGEIRADRGGRTLVFVRTKRGADRLAKKLAGRGIQVAAMHGNKSQSQRTKALSRFDAGRIDALVATDVAARGIDVKGITRVINFDPPGDHTDYVHRVGRTGRAGADGEGVTLVLEPQAADMARIERKLDLGAAWHGTDRPEHASPKARPAHRGSRRRRR
jgi:ATP-dependent RNA helicase RhlE